MSEKVAQQFFENRRAMEYDTCDRRAIKRLSGSARALFEVIEREEKGEIINVPGVCSALQGDPNFVAFSCIYGDGKRELLENNLGMVFAANLRAKMDGFLSQLKIVGYKNQLLVIIDDTEPLRFWKWETTQEEITTWLTMVIEDTDIPSGWNVRLWSDVERGCKEMFNSGTRQPPSYEEFYAAESATITQSVPYHNLFQHIKAFPNKGLKDVPVCEAVAGKLIQYKYECLALNSMLSDIIIIQTETPWEVKDPLFRNPLKDSPMNIIHPFERWR